MRIRYRVPAFATTDTSDDVIDPPAEVHGWRYANVLEPYLDQELADAGIRGGEIHAVLAGDEVQIIIDFWSPNRLEADVARRLLQDVKGQLSDGAGEGGFLVAVSNGVVLLHAVDGAAVSVEVADDGRPAPPLSRAGMAARDGDLLALQRAVAEDSTQVDLQHQGYSPLQLAILYGHPTIARWLIEAGADVRMRSRVANESALDVCVFSNGLSDEESAALATLLLATGADRGECQSLIEGALMREKPLTAETLRRGAQ